MCPTYGFYCATCDKPVDLWLKISEYDPEHPYPCPDCGAVLKRVIDSMNFILSGPGWFNSGGY